MENFVNEDTSEHRLNYSIYHFPNPPTTPNGNKLLQFRRKAYYGGIMFFSSFQTIMYKARCINQGRNRPASIKGGRKTKTDKNVKQLTVKMMACVSTLQSP